MYLDVSDKVRNGKAILISPLMENSYSNCIFNFSFNMEGVDVGKLHVRVSTNNSYPTILYDVQGKV